MLKRYKKKWLLILLISVLCLSSFIYILNIKVTYRQGINYEVRSVQIPLYFKLLTFINRHYSYKLLVERIVNKTDNEKIKVLKLFRWTNENIRKVPEGLPIVDDHALNIIIRGYGTNDQSSDVFSVLCNYAGFESFFTWIPNENKTSRIPLTFVRLNQGWGLFDPYLGNYFINRKGMFALVDDFKKGLWNINRIGNDKEDYTDYSSYFKKLLRPEKIGLQRSNIQSPINRFIYEIKRFVKPK